MNHFEALQLTPYFILDGTVVRKAFIAIQKTAHPDFGDESDLSELANQAFELFKKKEGVVRAFVLMYRPENALNANQLPSDFLMEMMELSDLIEESAHLDESLKSPENNEAAKELKRWETALEQELVKLQLEFPESNLQVQENLKQLLDALIVWYQKSRYINRLTKNFMGIEEM